MTEKHIEVLSSNYQSVDLESGSDEGFIPSVIIYVSNEDAEQIEGTNFYLEYADIETTATGTANILCSVEDEEDDTYTFTVPLALLSLLTAFGDSKRGMLILIYGEDYLYTVETGEPLSLENHSASIIPPDIETKDFESLFNNISEELSIARTTPMISTLKDALSPHAEKARELSFLVTAGIALGDDTAMRKLNSLYEMLVNKEMRESGSNASINKETMLADTVEEHDRTLDAVTLFFEQAYAQSEKLIRDISPKTKTQDFSEEDLEFVNILNHEGLIEKLNSISFSHMKDQAEQEGRTPELDIHAPLLPEWPEVMRNTKETFLQQSYPSPLHSFLEGKRKGLQEFNKSLTTLAQALTIAGRVRRFADQLEMNDRTPSVAGILVRCFNVEDERDTWELVSLKHSLQHYDLILSKDMLGHSLSFDDDPSTALWLHAVSSGVIINMIEFGLKPEQISLIVKESEIKPPNVGRFEKTVIAFLNAFYEEIFAEFGAQSDSEATISVDKNDLMRFSVDFYEDFLAEEEEDVTLIDIAEDLSILFPILADKMTEHLSLGSEEWSKTRESLIHQMLEACSMERAFA